MASVRKRIEYLMRDGKPRDVYTILNWVRSWKWCREQSVDRQLQHLVDEKVFNQWKIENTRWYRKLSNDQNPQTIQE